MRQQFAYKRVLSRYNVLIALVAIGLIGIVGKAAYTMFAERDYWEEVDDRFIREGVEIKPMRGDILADDGQVLATSLPKYRLFVDYVIVEKDSARRDKLQAEYDSIFDSKVDSLAEGLSRVFPDKTKMWFKSRLLQGKIERKRHWSVYPRQVSFIEYMEVRKLPFFNMGTRSGFHTEKYMQTKKPFGSLASSTIGGLWPQKDSARYGLQLAFDSLLRGKPGMVHRKKVRNRYVEIVDQPAEDGLDIKTTINVNLQDFAEKTLADKLKEVNGKGGVVVLMEVKTGDVKAIVNLERQEDGSFMDVGSRAVSSLMEPGSVFKPMSFMVAFNDGKIKMTDRTDTGNGQKKMYGRWLRDHNWYRGGYGVLTVPECLEYSSNVGVGGLIDKYYHDEPEKFVDGLYKIGIAEDLHLDIPGYAAPRIRRPKPDGSNWSNTALAWMSIGYESQVPPISVLNFYNGVANNGRMVRPRLVTQALRNGEVVKEFPVQVVREQMCSASALENIQTSLEWVVSKGLGRKAGSKHFKVSGKTGTAQVWGAGGFTGDYLVSFAGYFPSDAPKYSCIVCIQKHGLPASGGGQCGPVFKAVAERAMSEERTTDMSSRADTVYMTVPLVAAGNLEYAREALEGVGIKTLRAWQPREDMVVGKVVTSAWKVTLEESEVEENEVPNVVGMGARDAVYLLEKMGLKVEISGMGWVRSQSLPAGRTLKGGETIKIELGKKEIKKSELKAARPKAESIKTEESGEKKDTVKTDTVKVDTARAGTAKNPSVTDGVNGGVNNKNQGNGT